MAMGPFAAHPGRPPRRFSSKHRADCLGVCAPGGAPGDPKPETAPVPTNCFHFALPPRSCLQRDALASPPRRTPAAPSPRMLADRFAYETPPPASCPPLPVPPRGRERRNQREGADPKGKKTNKKNPDEHQQPNPNRYRRKPARCQPRRRHRARPRWQPWRTAEALCPPGAARSPSFGARNQVLMQNAHPACTLGVDLYGRPRCQLGLRDAGTAVPPRRWCRHPGGARSLLKPLVGGQRWAPRPVPCRQHPARQSWGCPTASCPHGYGMAGTTGAFPGVRTWPRSCPCAYPAARAPRVPGSPAGVHGCVWVCKSSSSFSVLSSRRAACAGLSASCPGAADRA